MLTEANLSALLVGRGRKLTQPRRAVLKVIAASTESLTPAEIHARAQQFYRHTGLVTVYRTLDLLTACGADARFTRRMAVTPMRRPARAMPIISSARTVTP